ncbi:MAG: hypothetical protein L6R36_007862 [Xanthoria steineri]|nr:MAG: hypothetical protein L6R36_007862 [Xanthoria steineri]
MKARGEDSYSMHSSSSPRPSSADCFHHLPPFVTQESSKPRISHQDTLPSSIVSELISRSAISNQAKSSMPAIYPSIHGIEEIVEKGEGDSRRP